MYLLSHHAFKDRWISKIMKKEKVFSLNINLFLKNMTKSAYLYWLSYLYSVYEFYIVEMCLMWLKVLLCFLYGIYVIEASRYIMFLF